MNKQNNKFRPVPLRLALLVAAALAGSARAGDGDAFHPFVAVGVSHEDNLFRLPDGDTGVGGRRGDTMKQGSAGLVFDRSYSLQHLYLQAKASKVSFDHFSELDYDGRDILGRWNWQLGRQFSGTLEGAYNRTLAQYVDFHGTERNLRSDHRVHLDAGWLMHPSWKLRAGLTRDRFDYELGEQRFNNRTEKLSEVGVDYLSRSENYAGLVLRRLEGDYPVRRFIGTLAVDESFTQDELKARVYWRGSGITSVDMLAGWARRRHVFFTDRDVSGADGRVTVIWTPRGKLRWTAAAWRQFVALESSVVSYSLNKGASLGARYDATAKTRFEANASYERRAFDPRLGFSAGQHETDALRQASVGVTTNPSRHLELSLNAFRQARSGNPTLGMGSFTANGVSFAANATF